MLNKSWRKLAFYIINKSLKVINYLRFIQDSVMFFAKNDSDKNTDLIVKVNVPWI